MVNRGDTQHCMPTVSSTADLASRKIEQRLRADAGPLRRRAHCNWDDGRQNLGSPEDGMLPEGLQRVMGESRYPTSS